MIDISRALTVEGWMGELELTYLAEMASKSRNIAEVGSWMGRSTCALAANTPGFVVAVDTWQGSAEHQSMLAAKPPYWIMDEFKKNTQGLPVNIANVTSLGAAAAYAAWGAKFDLVFLDASHDYESVKADIVAWTPLLNEGGILCGHDFTEHWPGVVQAVKELVPAYRIVENTSIWTTEAA